ncbi:MAG: bifunctional UDP-sugar hydrolase/5'-nucleotidase [Christensenella sp.]|nr:bifunctional UDP-sugar hydrolase/5'-nucleotidase [Christensenella sp.]
MRNKILPAMVLIFILILSLFPAFAAAEQAPDPSAEQAVQPVAATTVTLYHTNDVHGSAAADFDTIGYARMQAYMNQDTSDGKLLLDAGDAFHGNNFANLNEGQSIAEIMHEMGYDAFVPGSHDFSYGLEALQNLVESSGADALSVNLMKNGIPVFDAYHIYTAGGLKIGVVGIASPSATSTAGASSASGISVLTGDSLYQKTQQAIDEMRASGANAVIALTHLGTKSEDGMLSSIDVATHVTGLDLIIDGNTHTSYPAGYTDYPGYTPGQTPIIVSADDSFESFGATQLVFDENNYLMGIVPSIITTDMVADLKPDKTINGLINTYDQEHQTFLERVITQSPVFLNGEPDYLYSGETNFSTLLTRSMQVATGADIAFISSSSIHTSIPAGDITAAEVNNAVSSGNYIVTTTISGAELKRILNEHMILGQDNFPQFYGFHVLAEKYLNSDGLYAARVKSITKDGKEIKDTDSLTVALTDDIYYGGDGYSFSGKLLQESETLFDIFREFLNTASSELLSEIPQSEQLTMLEETIDTDSVIAKLQLAVPVDVTVDLKKAVVVPENILYALMGQSRELVFTIHSEYPYRFVFDGAALQTPVNVSLEANVSQSAPPGKRTASTADENAFFVDLSDNATIPGSVLMRIPVGSAYPPGSAVYIYYYDQNNDILPYDIDGLMVAEDGTITFPVQAGATYLINSKLLNAATSFDLPTRENPYIWGISIICIAFAAWVVFFMITKKGSQKQKQ